MRILLFGATGMVGAGVLRECLLASDVTEIRAVGRTPTGRAHPKLHETVVQDLYDPGPTAWRKMTGYDACFFCLGVTSSGLTEAEYVRLTHDLTLAVAERLALLDPDMTFVYVSGAGTDGGGRGRSMWARVKGRTENALQALPFAGAFMFRPAVILPMHGERSKTTSYRLLYLAGRPGAASAAPHRPRALPDDGGDRPGHARRRAPRPGPRGPGSARHLSGGHGRRPIEPRVIHDRLRQRDCHPVLETDRAGDVRRPFSGFSGKRKRSRIILASGTISERWQVSSPSEQP